MYLSMGNTDKNKSKKYRKKIRIRLKDPNIPDSYVCEIFDSSLENDEEESKNDGLEEREDPSKPKNYFELLMSKECRKNHVNNSAKLPLNHSLKVDDQETYQKAKKTDQASRKSLPESVDIGTAERKCDTDSSDDESLLQIQRNSKLQNLDDKEEDDCVYIGKESTADEELNSSSEILTVFESPKIALHKKKTFSILNYFSKTNTSLKNRVNCDRSEEIKTVKKSLKTSQTSNSLNIVKKQDFEKTVQNEKKILNGINKENVKLAPLFNKKTPKIIDTAKQKARLDFLYKESSIIKKSESKSTETVLTFPTYPHVQQRNDSACWSRREVCLPLPQVQHSDDYALSNNKIFSLEIEDSDVRNNSVTDFQCSTDKDILYQLKCRYLDLKLEVVIDGLKEKRDRFLVRAEKIEKNSGNQDKNGETGFEELNALWIDKYKPKSNEILGNDKVVKKLKKWLESWKSFDEELKNLVKTNRSVKNNESDEDSDDDFLDTNSQTYGLRAPCNVCFISGPNGCGKTALVYALACELEFHVLELNASSKRTGKKVLSDLQEATQSHKVQRVNLLQTDAFQREAKKKKNPKRKKSKKIVKTSEVADQTNDSKISLILIEDADIVYEEHDEGFFSAIVSLVQSSKRPLIFLTNEPNCHNLYNFKTEQCLVLEMEPPSFHSSCAILDVVSALEGASLDREFLEYVVHQNNFDLRRSLLQVEFWMHSSKTFTEKRFDLGQLWWGLSKFLFKQDMRHFVKNNSRKRKRVNDLFDSSDDELLTAAKKHKSDSVNSKNSPGPSPREIPEKPKNPSILSYFKVLDLASTLDRFCLPGSQEPIPGAQSKPKDSLSLEENVEEGNWIGKNLAEEISGELVRLSARMFVRKLKEKNVENRKLDFVPPCWEEIRWRNSQVKASEELSMLVSLQRGRENKSLHLDYLPILRKICRVERNRSEMNPKRKNRFYHYLNNLGLEVTDENLEINCDVLERP